MWNESQDEIVEGIGSLVPNFPPERDTYTHAEVRLFLEFVGLTQLFFRAPGFAEKIVGSEEVLDVDAARRPRRTPRPPKAQSMSQLEGPGRAS
jgi:hypothetical protein